MDLEKLRGKLDCGEYFIPEQVGLESIDDLTEQFGANEDDDDWHEFVGVRNPAPGEELLETDGDALLKAFLAVEHWDPALGDSLAKWARCVSPRER